MNMTPGGSGSFESGATPAAPSTAVRSTSVQPTNGRARPGPPNGDGTTEWLESATTRANLPEELAPGRAPLCSYSVSWYSPARSVAANESNKCSRVAVGQDKGD